MNQSKHFILLIAVFLFCSCQSDRYVSFSGYAQGGTYEVKANLRGVRSSRKAIAEKIDSILTDIDFSISGYNKNSILSRYNAGEEIQTDRHFSEILSLSDRYEDMTGGAFSAKAAPLFDIWGFGFTTDSLPSEERIKIALAESKSGKVLNFNAIAQGYSCDVIASYLRSIGVEDMLVNIGEIYCSGVNPEGEGWKIGVDSPIDGNNNPGEHLSGIWESDGRACGIVTSGNYRKFYIKDGRKYSHTIDPRNGYPVQHDLLSATIVAPTAAEADALATACMVMGPEKAIEFIERLEEVEAYFIFSEGSWTSEGFALK